ncbi:hypothetical protein MBLNU459_g2432t1 [Dothideomycetes sp. NU459]
MIALPLLTPSSPPLHSLFLATARDARFARQSNRRGSIHYPSTQAAPGKDRSLADAPSQSSTLSHTRRKPSDEPHDLYEPYTTSLQQRQQQAQAYLRNQSLHLSPPSSSSGSAAHTLRRTPRFDEERRSPRRPRSASLDSSARSPEQAGEREPGPRSHRRATSAHPHGRTPHPALRVSRRTASAILFALEEAIRTPNLFTPDLAEEHAQMSDLGGGNGRASSSGPRATGGNVPVAQTSNSGLRTPREIMKDREAREARRRAEAERESAEEARRALEEDRRRSAERRAAAGVAEPSRDSATYRRAQGVPAAAGSSSQPPPSARGEGGRAAAGAGAGAEAGAGAQSADPLQSGGRVQESLRASVPSSRFSPARQPRNGAAQPTPGPRRQPAQSGLRQSSAPAASPPAATDVRREQDARVDEPPKASNVSSFPHAFERWEQLSSHWEGLTSYWLHKLESNSEEIARTVPSASAMSRQITDLSAAGANLFHAVVELQRLRASSERKFQRWFFETRGDQERAQEMQAELERRIKLEQTARADAVAEAARADQDKRNAERMVGEMRRELLISKEEARRAWEELGRREQEERDRTVSLREGMPTIVGGVQVVPMHTSAGVSLQGSERRPTTSEGPQYQTQRMRDPVLEEEYREGDPSPTDTDPFTDVGRAAPPAHAHREPAVQSVAAGTYQPYPLGSTPATSGSTAQTAIPPQQRARAVSPMSSAMRAPAVTATSQAPVASGAIIQPASRAAPRISPPQVSPEEEAPELFYQHPTTQTSLLSPPLSISGPPARSPPAVPAPQQHSTQELRSQASYVSSQASTEDTEYEIDSQGQLRLDAQGRPVVFRSTASSAVPPQTAPSHPRGTTSEESDDYDVAADVAHERELAARYGGVQAPSPPPAPSGSYASPPAGYAAAAPADYEGQGFGGWEAVQSRHHHPTRLSDVLEEDERSRTTGE